MDSQGPVALLTGAHVSSSFRDDEWLLSQWKYESAGDRAELLGVSTNTSPRRAHDRSRPRSRSTAGRSRTAFLEFVRAMNEKGSASIVTLRAARAAAQAPE
jgi:hypothetical protein